MQRRFTPLDNEKGTHLTHLKRVRRTGQVEDNKKILDILLCDKATLSEEELQPIVEDAFKEGFEITPRIELVSRWAAYNTRQIEDFGKLWPVTLRKDTLRHTYPELQKSDFRTVKNPAKEATEMQKCMVQTISLCNVNKAHHPEDLCISALLVDPKTSQILLTAHDTRVSTNQPLNHAIMNLLNKLSTHFLAQPRRDLKEGEEEQYYAHMYDVYTTHEPCTMCCMALVHSRIRRLVFWRGTETGARGLGWMKGDEEDPKLNHRYMCFAGIGGALEEDSQVEELDSGVYA